MPTTVQEAAISRSRQGRNVDLIYYVHGTDSEITARADALTTAPSTYDGLARQDAEVSTEPLVVVEGHGGSWLVRIPYAPNEWGFFVGSDSYTFDTSGGTVNIKQSRGVAAKYPNEAPDIGTADGGGPVGLVKGDAGMEVGGIDVPTGGVFEWEETHIFSWAEIDDEYKDRVCELTGRINDAPFGDCAAGEALFLGCRGGQLPDGTAALTFRFAKSKNTASGEALKIGNIEGVEKKGWQHLEVIYEQKAIGSGAHKILVSQPKYVYVHDIFIEDDFEDLGI